MLIRTRYFLVGATFGALAATVTTVALGALGVLTLPDEDYNALAKSLRKARNSIDA